VELASASVVINVVTVVVFSSIEIEAFEVNTGASSFRSLTVTVIS